MARLESKRGTYAHLLLHLLVTMGFIQKSSALNAHPNAIYNSGLIQMLKTFVSFMQPLFAFNRSPFSSILSHNPDEIVTTYKFHMCGCEFLK